MAIGIAVVRAGTMKCRHNVKWGKMIRIAIERERRLLLRRLSHGVLGGEPCKITDAFGCLRGRDLQRQLTNNCRGQPPHPLMLKAAQINAMLAMLALEFQ